MTEHIFNDRAQSFDGLPWFNDPILLKWASHNLRHYGESIADIGSGTGLILPYLVKDFDCVTAVEPNQKMFEKLQHVSQPLKIDSYNIGFHEFLDIHVKPDIILFKNSLHHVGDYPLIIGSALARCEKAVAILDIVGPDKASTQFASELVRMKEPTRSAMSFVDVSHLHFAPSGHMSTGLYFDQFIIVEDWLDNASTKEPERSKIIDKIRNAPASIKSSMKIHVRDGKLLMLRRNELFVIQKPYTSLVKPD